MSSRPTARALIADDEQHQAVFLRAQLARLWPELEIVGIAKNGLEALALIDDYSPDIAFLDIKMPGLNGLEVAARAAAKIHVVFITAFDDYAVEAFDREAVDYLLKPPSDERLNKTVLKLQKKIIAHEVPQALQQTIARIASLLPHTSSGYLRWIRASVGDTIRQIPVEEVLYFQATDKYTRVITQENESLIRLTLAELVDELNPDLFKQIHRSTIVNMNCVVATRRDLSGRIYVKIKNHARELPVSRAYLHLFKQM